MPILAKETDLFPNDLLDRTADSWDEQQWWAVYTRSRREKQLMRQLEVMGVGYYGPTVPHRYRSPAGHVRTSHVPLFANYVFVFGDEAARYKALTTNCVSRWFPVPDRQRLTDDLRQIRDLITVGEPLTPEARLSDGSRVRVLSGSFRGFEGVILRRQNETWLLVAVDFMQQGASVLLDACQLEPLG